MHSTDPAPKKSKSRLMLLTFISLPDPPDMAAAATVACPAAVLPLGSQKNSLPVTSYPRVVNVDPTP